MKKLTKFLLTLGLVAAMVMPFAPVTASAEQITTTATGYTKASDVVYKDGTYLANWGARGEDCTFLSKYAAAFYTGSNVYDTLSQKKGGSSQSNASSSALYSSLQTLMKSKHKYETSYAATREMYRYTDCVSNNTSNISSFYSGKVLTGNWDGAVTWNREHTWPNSKGKDGNDENDIIMLRPTWVQENSSRGNTAYGESSGYYDPGESVRGDCARIVLYVYVRWGNTSYMWGKSGVMENMNVLLNWMEEDPVDTWEMGRNDVVEDITGTRNVFVDYPEYAWLLFGKSVPTTLSTPSGEAKDGGVGGNSSNSSEENSSSENVTDSSVGGSSNESSSNSSSSNNSSSNESSSNNNSVENSSDNSATSSEQENGNECQHQFSDWTLSRLPQGDEKYIIRRQCQLCGNREKIEFTIGNGEEETGDAHQKTCQHQYGDWTASQIPQINGQGTVRRKCQLCGDRDSEMFTVVLETTSEGCESTVGLASGVMLMLALGGWLWTRKKREDTAA